MRVGEGITQGLLAGAGAIVAANLVGRYVDAKDGVDFLPAAMVFPVIAGAGCLAIGGIALTANLLGFVPDRYKSASLGLMLPMGLLVVVGHTLTNEQLDFVFTGKAST